MRARRGTGALLALGLAVGVAGCSGGDDAATTVASAPLASSGAASSSPTPASSVSPAALAAEDPAMPGGEYPVYGSDELVKYLARALVNQEDPIDLTSFAGASDGFAVDVMDAMSEVIAQDPYVYLDSWDYWDDDPGPRVLPVYLYDDAAADGRRAETAAVVDEILATSDVAAAADDDELALALHDAVIVRTEYDWEASEAIDSFDTTDAGAALVARSQQASGALVDGTAVCNGYAQAFLVLAEAAGLDAVLVTGTTDGSDVFHAWNKVLIDGSWMVVDATWDDTDVGAPLRDYFLLGDGDPLLDGREADTDWMVDAYLGDYGE
ncbi:transglutaminase domain-containing protein [Demequina salsinemoris]|uniref:transglutaminase domain-containing protein n=1 Tax=Demequina salsinemoris TaxID=577470 RepID=UPI0007823D8F|nr:transglutaminase domain-containing protein [Demequina salsinemoris]